MVHFIPGGNTTRLTEGKWGGVTKACKETQIFQSSALVMQIQNTHSDAGAKHT